MNKPAPCMGCPDRTPECHGQCERYKAFKAEKAKANAQEREAKGLDWLHNRREIVGPKLMNQRYQKRRCGR